VALEEIGSGGLQKFVERIKKRYPNHNFDVPPPPDTKCKSPVGCAGLNNITYYDNEGNIFCGRRYKETKVDNPYDWMYRECHALLKPSKQEDNREELPF